MCTSEPNRPRGLSVHDFKETLKTCHAQPKPTHHLPWWKSVCRKKDCLVGVSGEILWSCFKRILSGHTLLTLTLRTWYSCKHVKAAAFEGQGQCKKVSCHRTPGSWSKWPKTSPLSLRFWDLSANLIKIIKIFSTLRSDQDYIKTETLIPCMILCCCCLIPSKPSPLVSSVSSRSHGFVTPRLTPPVIRLDLKMFF